VAEEIQNGIAAGKEVTVHEKAINAYGFSGFGYIIIDPETGVGGYLIEGKGSGALILILTGYVLALITFLWLPELIATIPAGAVGVGIWISVASLSLSLITAGLALALGDLGLCKAALGVAARAITALALIGSTIDPFLLNTIPIASGFVTSYLVGPRICR